MFAKLSKLLAVATITAILPISFAPPQYAPVSAQSASSATKSFESAKNTLEKRIYATPESRVDFYCGCRYTKDKKIVKSSCGYIPRNPDSRRSKYIEFEHIVPASAFVNAFQTEIRSCPKGKSKRECARKNPVFKAMEGDMNNLVPAVGEVNGLRSDHSYAMLVPEAGAKLEPFGKCGSTLGVTAKKFEPKDGSKGWAARTYLYMEETYPGHGIVSGKNRKLFEVWDAAYPVTAPECSKAYLVVENGGNANRFQETKCREAGIWKR